MHRTTLHSTCMRVTVQRLLALAVLLALAASGAARAGDRVRVLTSYPEELTVRYQAAFEARHPGKRVEILWRQSADALAWLRRQRGQVDVYWAPAPGNFAALRDQRRLLRLELDREALPDAVGGSPISDAEGYFAAFELAGYGIAYNREALARLGLEAPREWRELAAAAYQGQVQMPIPGRVGFAPALVEALLQGEGWDAGWALLAAIAGNGALAGRGGNRADADDVAAGRVAARMTIDFFAARAIADGAPVAFAYPRRTLYNPAQIAIFADAPNPAGARAFVDFALSDAGQRLLLHPDVRRLPVRKALYLSVELPAQPFASDSLGYDGELGRARQGLVAALFDIALVRRNDELVELWRRLQQAEGGGQAQHPALLRARQLLSAAPMALAEQADSELRQAFANPTTASEPLRTRREAEWMAAVDARIAAARAALRQAAR
ncbi:ABC transporter substrate-binding protein [Stutzerimonas kirkiae]|uniref:ABC transporter substrate-binding protein n=1 Tax=Stutzerimonas kirkiae TaxID=2211392 RepID=UPI001038511C|nr:extracellular solute-binding protein [Stutzerimonas kirkiae]TBV09669.1 hypothetical protein DNK08_08555 [Stutzerimonas kirkiae]